jgi:hypothetical protein
MTHYWPILFLTAFSKVFEKAMHSRLNQHLHSNNVLVPEQHAFRQGISTEYAAFRLIESVLSSVHQKQHVGGIFYDLAKLCKS